MIKKMAVFAGKFLWPILDDPKIQMINWHISIGFLVISIQKFPTNTFNESTQVQVHFKKTLSPKINSGRSDKSRRKTLNDIPKSKKNSNVCTFCNQSFKDYKKLISHYDECVSIG